MTTAPTSELVAKDRDRMRRAAAPTGLAVLLPISALTIYGAHNLAEIITVLTIVVVVVAAVYGFLLPRKLRAPGSAGGVALALSAVAAVVLVPAFWSGLPLALGAAGVMLGYADRNAPTGSAKSVAALVIGALASIGYFAIYILDTLSQLGVPGT